MRSLFTVLLLLAAPAALAHNPPVGPDPACENGALHDYAGTFQIRLNPYGGPHGARIATADGSVADTACGVPDGHEEFGVGGAILFVDDGDGSTWGTVACHGVTAHHGTTIYAEDVQGFGPRFYAIADWSRTPPASGPDCGDDIFEPCTPGAPPTPSPYPFPVNVVVDIVDAVLYEVFDNPGPLCTPQDAYVLGTSTATAPSVSQNAALPGADGTVLVVPAWDALNGRIPLAGHVWTN